MAYRPIPGGTSGGLILVLAGAIVLWTPVYATDTTATAAGLDSLRALVLADLHAYDIEREAPAVPAEAAVPVLEREVKPPVGRRTAQYLTQTAYLVPLIRAPPFINTPIPDW